MNSSGFFNNPTFRYNFALRASKDMKKLPSSINVIQHAEQMQKVAIFYAKLGLKHNSQQNINDLLKAFTKSINHRYILNQSKAFIFEDSIMLYSWLLSNPNAQQSQILKIVNYLYDRYLFRQLPQVMGCIIGRLLIYRMFNQEEKIQVNKTIDKIYQLTKRDRSFCDMSKMMYLTLMDMWNRWGEKCIAWEEYNGWRNFRKVQETFWALNGQAMDEVRQIWVEFGLNEERHQHEVVQLLRKLTDYQDFTTLEISANFFCLIYMISFLIDEHKHVQSFSEDLVKTLGHILSKVCYLPLNPWFIHMNAFLILYKLAVKEKDILGDAVLKLHMVLRASLLFYKKYSEKGKIYIVQFRQRIRNDPDFTQNYDKLDKELQYVVELKQITQNPSQFFSYGQSSPTQRKQSFQMVFKTLHSQPSKHSESQAKICRSIMRAKPQILNYAQQKTTNLQYLQLYLSLNKIHKAFMTKLQQLCRLQNSIQHRHKHVKYLYTWFSGAYMLIMKHISSEENLLLREGFMSRYFAQQVHSQLVSRMADLGMIDIDFRKVYDILFEEYTIDDVIVMDFSASNFAVKEIFDTIEKMAWNVGSPMSYYELQKLRKYFNTYVTKSYGITKDSKKQQSKQEMRRIVDIVMKKKQMMMNRPEKKFVKTEQSQNKKEQKERDILESFNVYQDLKYPVYYDAKHHLIKTTIFMILQKMQEYRMCQQKEYWEMFVCVVTVLDSQKLLLEIYANMMFTVLSSNEKKLVDWGYQNLNLMRKSLSEKWRSELPCSEFTINGMLCIYERLRKIEIKKERWKSKAKSSGVSIDKSSGKSKIYTEQQTTNTEQSKIYQRYFENLFEGKPYEILSYGKQLVGMRKYREAVYVLEMVNDQLKRMALRKELDLPDPKGHRVSMKQLQGKNTECDMALCDCYAVLVSSFKDVQHITRRQCIQQRINDSKEQHHNNIYKKTTDKQNQQQKQPYPTTSMIEKITKMIKNQYHKNHTFFWQDKVVLDRNQDKLKDEDVNLEFLVYSHITNYSMCELSKISTRQDFKTYYLTIVISAMLHKWYYEKKCNLIIRKIDEMSRKNSEWEVEEQERQQLSMGQVKQPDSFHIEPEKEILYMSFDDIVRNVIGLVVSPADRLRSVEMMYAIEEIDNLRNMQTIRIHNQAILQAGKMGIIFDFCESSYGGEYFECMTLFELEVLQRYYFETGNYQQVKLIAKCMMDERNQELYSKQPGNFICWPQVFCYDLLAKLYDDNLSSDFVVGIRWHEFLKLIDADVEVVVDGKRESFLQLKNPSYIKEMKQKQPTRFGKLRKQLENKIKQYFKLLRIIFDRIQLRCKMAINIFLVLQKIFTGFFIPQLVEQQLYIDFFLYYLRFLCEGVDCNWFEIEGDAQFRNGMQVIQLDEICSEVRVEYLDRGYVLLRTTNTVVLLMQNVEWVKYHFFYMVRALDEQKDTKKNLILKRLIVQAVLKNPVEHVWNMTFLKYYGIKFPSRFLQNRPSNKRTYKFQQMSNFQYDDDSILNKRHDAIIKQIFEEIVAKMGEAKYESLVEIPELFMEILEVNACDKAMRKGFAFEVEANVLQRTKEINSKIKLNNWRIPYPLDPKLYIKSLGKFNILGSGKSVPTNFDVYCRPYSELKGDVYKNDKMMQTIVDDTLKSFIFKYNFTREDFLVETATANFYNEIGMLDKETTYAILNLSKYILMIEKIQVKHTTMYELLDKACKIDQLDVKGVEYARLNDIRCQQNQVSLTPGFYDVTKQQKHNPLLQDEQISLFKSFFKEGLKKRRNIDEWWKYIDNFVRTLAQWSYLCYLTKLGDRHNSNILVTETGKLIHIDYEYNFAHGLVLAYPEWVPFRLTDALVSVLGTFKEKGTFYGYFLDVAKRFDPTDENTWKALANFLPEQRKIVQSSSMFKNFEKESTIEEICQKIIDTSRNDSLLRLMYRGWLSIV